MPPDAGPAALLVVEVVDEGTVVEVDEDEEVVVATELDVVGATEVEVVGATEVEVVEDDVLDVEVLGVDVLVTDDSAGVPWPGGVCASAAPAETRGARNDSSTATERRNEVPELDRRTAPVNREFRRSWLSCRICSPSRARAPSPSAGHCRKRA